jgi:hypothetical protein
VDSKAVSQDIKRRIWTALRDAGFLTFTSRTAWRHGDDGVDVFNVSSFSKYNADVLGITSFSFSVNLGRYLSYVPPQWPPKTKGGKVQPSEPECLFRGRLLPMVGDTESNKRVWVIDPDGRNLGWCIQDVINQLPKALEWYASLDNRSEVLRILQQEDETMEGYWGFGRNPSPARSYAAGYVALALGDEATARAHLQAAVDSNCFVHLFTGVEGALARAV